MQHIPQELHHVHHRIIIVGDMHLIAFVLRPELRPSAIVVLPAEQVLHRLAESGFVALVPCLMEETCQECHLHDGRVVVDGRVILTRLADLHGLGLLVRQRLHHVDILRPAARDTLKEQQLVAYPASLIGLEEKAVARAQSIPLPSPQYWQSEQDDQ